jgi:hypothetical protein
MFEDTLKAEKERGAKDKLIAAAPIIGGILGGIAGASRGNRMSGGSHNFETIGTMLQGFMQKKASVSKPDAQTIMHKAMNSLLEKRAETAPPQAIPGQAIPAVGHAMAATVGRRVGEAVGGITGDMVAKRLDKVRQAVVDEAALKAINKKGGNWDDVGDVIAYSGFDRRQHQATLGAGLAIGGAATLLAFNPTFRQKVVAPLNKMIMAAARRYGDGQASARVADFLAHGIVQHGLAATALGATVGFAAPIAGQVATAASQFVNRSDLDKVAFLDEFDKRAGSLLGMMPGITSGLRTTKSFGKIRTAQPKSGISIGARFVKSPVPGTPSAAAVKAGIPGAVSSQVGRSGIPKPPMQYGAGLQGAYI